MSLFYTEQFARLDRHAKTRATIERHQQAGPQHELRRLIATRIVHRQNIAFLRNQVATITARLKDLS